MGYDFNGTSAKISWGDVTILDGLAAFSIHCWANCDTISGFTTLVDKMNAGATSGIRMMVDDGSGINVNSLLATYGDGSSSINGNTATNTITTAAGWQSVGITVSNTLIVGVLTPYVDGVVGTPGATAGFGTFPNNTEVFQMGVNASGARWFDGQLAELACWNRELTSTEMTTLASGQSALFIPSGLIFYARLSADPNDEIGSLTGTVTNATLAGHPTITYPGGVDFTFINPWMISE